MARSARVFPLVLLASLGCSDSDEARSIGRPNFVIEDPGTGDPNAEPLFPLHVGARRVFDTSQITYVLDHSERWQRSSVRYAVQGRGGEDDDVRFFRETEDGVVYDGSVRVLGKLPRPILLVPREVREGMRWKIPASEGEDALGTFTVERRDERSLFGTRPVWRITQKNEVTGTEVYTDYAEGRGPISLTDRNGNEAKLRAAVVSLDDPESARTPPHVAVTPFANGQRLVDDSSLWVTEVSAITPPGGAPELRLGGSYAWYSNTGFSAGFVLSPAVVCVPVAGGRFGTPRRAEYPDAGTFEPDRPCPRATHAHFAGGALEIVPEKGEEYNDRFGAPFASAAGERLAVGRRATDGGMDANVVWYFGWPGDVRPSSGGHLGSIDLPWRGAGDLRGIYAEATTASDALPFAIALGEQLFFGRAPVAHEARTSPTTLTPLGSAGGYRVTAALDSNGRVLLATSRDGRVMRVDLSSEQPARRVLAQLDLPDRHELVGAIPFEGGLLAIAQVGREDFAAGRKAAPALGSIHAFRAALDPLAPSEPAAAAPALDLVVSRSGRDARICRPGGAIALDGMTLGGQPAKVHPLGGGCALVLRGEASTDLAADDAWLIEGRVAGIGRIAIAHAAAGNGGALMLEELPLEHIDHPIAALKSGGVTGYGLRYTVGLTPIGAPPKPELTDVKPVWPGVTDAGGYGVWHVSNVDDGGPCPSGWTSCRRVRRWGDDHMATLAPVERPIAPLQGGGLLLQPGVLVTPDGKVTVLPLQESTPTEASTYTYLAGKSDGTACGYRTQQPSAGTYVHRYFCRTADGVVRVSDSDLAEPVVGECGSGWLPGVSTAGWLPGPGGFYCVGRPASDGSFWFFDEAALAMRPIEAPAAVRQAGEDGGTVLAVPSFSASGELFVQYQHMEAVRTLALLRFADGGAHAVPVPPAIAESLVGIDVMQPVLKLVVDDAFFTFLDATSTRRPIVRVLR